MMGLGSIAAASLLALSFFSPDVAATPAQGDDSTEVQLGAATAEPWWFANIPRQGKVPFGNNPNYQVFRNVKDFGAKGDGVTDDTAAINAAISSGQRCGQGCDSSTTTPAVVYIPFGTYVVSAPIILYYFTQLVGDATNLPILKAAPNFDGIAVLDSDPYLPGGANWYVNQNNFFRQVRNLRIDVSAQPLDRGTGIHWQVAQATSLQNIVFDMNKDTSPNNKQQGIFMDNGSGGHMNDLIFNGGGIGAFFGNQQFTSRNLTFNGCRTAVVMNWNWIWTLAGVTINNANIGIDMSSGGAIQAVGAVILLDSVISNTAVGVLTRYHPDQGWTNSTLVLDNVDMSTNTPIAVKNADSGATILGGNAEIPLYVQGRSYSGTSGQAVQATLPSVDKPAALLDANGRVFSRSKPQYEGVPASSFVSVISKGAKGDGVTDDTAAVQAAFDSLCSDEILFFPHGAYLMTDTVKLPSSVRVVGELWSVIIAGGNSAFKDQTKPKPVWQVGEPGSVGNVEIQDIIFETQGPQPGAILMEFNVAGEKPGSAGVWDTHFRVGGSAGTNLQSNTCSKNPSVIAAANPDCIGAFMSLHVTASASIYVENIWVWTADHELDMPDHNQINIFSGRGVVIQSTKPSWWWSAASEHHTLVNYNLVSASNVFFATFQTETAYFQGNPDATQPFAPNAKYGDPDFASCGSTAACKRTVGLRVVNSTNVFGYGTGLYSFFDNYAQDCVAANNCQANMIDIADSSVQFYGVTTKASVNMITLNNAPAALDRDNRNNFGATVASFAAS